MADYRTIHSKIWEDDWFCSLSAEEKVLWFYLITNHRASVSGIYILPERVIPFETGLDAETVKMILAHFIADEKIVCEQNVIWVKKLRDYQETKSNTIQKCIMKDVEHIPDGPVKQAYCIRYGYPIDTLGIPICTIRHDTTRHDTSTTRHDTTKTPATKINYDPTIPDNMPGGKNRPRI